MKKGVFTISIDFEFALGYPETVLSGIQKENIKKEIAVTHRLVSLFEKYEMPVTWAIVSHLLEKKCKKKNDLYHPEFPRPIYTNEKKDWFFTHPDTVDYTWYDTHNLIPLIQNSSPMHEIGSHSYSHIIYGAKNINEKAVSFDIKKASEIHNIYKLPFNSFIFPRNMEGYHDELYKNGLSFFRSNQKTWYENFPEVIKRLFHFFSYFIPLKKTGIPFLHSSGLIGVPGNMLLIGRNGMRALIPPALLVIRAKRSLYAAAKNKEIFHFWFHPSNFVFKENTQFMILEEILKYANFLKKRGDITMMTMNQVGEEFKQEQHV